MAKIAFIGLGNMGSPMASNLLKAEHQVAVFDLNPDACKALEAEGARVAESVLDAAVGVDYVISMLPAGKHVESVYLGDQLEKVFNDIKAGTVGGSTAGGLMDLGLSQILNFERDPGDRNRTSPFAFTGNRFEFRAVGSSQSVSGPLVAMNTLLADSLNWIAGKLESALDAGENQTDAVISVLKELMELHGNVVFGGDGYSSEWHTMAVAERGLKNIPTTADALPAFKDPAVVSLFEDTGVLSPVELESRFDVYSEQYILSIEVEAKLVRH